MADQTIIDGRFRIFIPTANHSALDIAKIFTILSYSLAAETGAGTPVGLDRIEIDASSEDAVTHWQPTAAFPTLSAFKDAILQTLAPLLNIRDVTIECEHVAKHHPGDQD